MKFLVGVIVVSFVGLGLMAWKSPSEERTQILKVMGSIVGMALLGLLVSSTQGIRW
ncbi:ubiquinol-cytochrome-c reductase complex assembly factor 3 [Streptomyces sp. NBC_00075]|uniref:hypothetical protein n=1 Tax=Streptomyces sp. NBC_00075 TaxID=2975641 RepID=UPI0032550708